MKHIQVACPHVYVIQEIIKRYMDFPFSSISSETNFFFLFTGTKTIYDQGLLEVLSFPSVYGLVL